MSSSINLDPSAGNPTVVLIDGICYLLAAGTSAPPDTSSAGSGSGCCPYTPAPCTCPTGLPDSYMFTGTDGSGATVTGTLAGPEGSCVWTSILSDGRFMDLELGVGPGICRWVLTAGSADNAKAAKPSGPSPAGSYSNLPGPEFPYTEVSVS
jgi:hypothetical protein